jgi:excisionase family DNA binding protein
MSTIIEGIKFYTIPETAEALQVTPQTIRAYIKKGRIKSQRIGRPILITENNLKEFLTTLSPYKKGMSNTDRLEF